ncbi:unnamed protein product [Prunus armeniaca]|uniref:Uncharacterized protein n=1 Tax=Prunus armeniaca TaxID=36596 RepID=A0A6J5WUF8_PRUAR|nr:unnamed protein product [Prunus armeniaca]
MVARDGSKHNSMASTMTISKESEANKGNVNNNNIGNGKINGSSRGNGKNDRKQAKKGKEIQGKSNINDYSNGKRSKQRQRVVGVKK